jgi:chemotaxis family two-component system response regulator Rcp1
MHETQMGLRPLELLLVEDSASDILLITETLREQPFPINVQVATDGEKALQVFADGHFRPDLVDLNIPKVHGFDVLKCCDLAEMRIVVFSSSSNPDDLRRSFELGAQEFVHKPIGLDEFRQQVTQIVRNWGPPHLVNAARNQLGH